MSIIDQASEEAERRHRGVRVEGLAANAWEEGALGGFMDGAQWLLDQLQDPDPETVDAVTRALAARRPDLDVDESNEVTEPCKTRIRADARAAITALTNHLNGADHE
jgi:hypothetical protein